MINIKYDRLKNETAVSLENFTIFKKDELPLTVDFTEVVTGRSGWSTVVGAGMWASWKGGEVQHDVTLRTAKGRIVHKHKFDVELNGDQIEKTLWHFLKYLDHSPKGLVIGSHDGTFGHWVFPVISGLTDVVIVEGSAKQYAALRKNYESLPKVKFIYKIVTTDGRPVDWFEGGAGFTDTIYKPVISIFLKDEEIKTSQRKSVSINDLIKKECHDLDWLHLDVEGIDGDLILALEYRPKLIIFEAAHIDQQQYSELLDWFENNQYELFNDGFNAIAIKK
jgi:hypothetical protein